MRPGNQSNKRIRGRGRKGPNPLSRTYESNGPDVKIRGTAHHVAEKYQQLARDAAASGDRIMSENYLQHAEHYLRIIATAQQSMQQPVVLPRGDGGEEEGEASADRAERSEQRPDRGDRRERSGGGEGSGKPVMPVDAPQPFVDNMPVLNAKGDRTSEDAGAKSQSAGEGSPEAEDDGERGRRRTRGTRGRGLRKARQSGSDEAKAHDEASPSGASADDTLANGAQDTVSAAPTDDAGEKPAAKPRARRSPRARAPKAAETMEAGEGAGEAPAPTDA